MADRYLTVGSGEHRVLAVHGWFGSARGWGSLPGFVDGTAYTYVFMNLRGYGDRKHVTGNFTTEEAANDAIALADELGWGQFSLIGHSMGGKVIQHVLLQAPHRTRSLIALNPVPASGVPFDEQSWALFDGAAENPENRAAIIDFTTGNRLTKSFINSIVEHSLEHSTKHAFGSYLPSWGKQDFSDQVKGNPAKVKIIVGEHDPALGAEFMQQTWFQHFPNAEMTVLANAGHYPMYETPVALATTIEGFLAEGGE
jgi:pimeloyl-ACP methyl ester carboxylesterase